MSLQHPPLPKELLALQGPAADGATLAADASRAGPGSVAAVLRRQWRLLLILWLPLACLGLAAVWVRVKPVFTASAQVEIAPIVPAILYQDQEPLPFFDVYLSTQAQLMTSQPVLAAALKDPAVRDISPAQDPIPLVVLRRSVAVTNIPRTNLLEVSVTHENQDAAVRLTRAVLEAYLAQAVGSDIQAGRTRREVLEAERVRLRSQLDQLGNQTRRLAEAYGTASDKMFEVLRTGLEKYTIETRQELERADLDVFQIRQRLSQLDDGTLPEELAGLREQIIDNAPAVRWLRQEIDKESTRLARLASVLPEDHRDVTDTRQFLRKLQADLEKARLNAVDAADKEIADKHKQRLSQAKARLQSDLTLAQRRLDVLKERVNKRDAEGMAIGRQGLEIQSLQEQREMAKQDYDRVSEAIRQLDIESRRPARISVASPAELRPDGIQDKRRKYAMMMLVASLLFSGGLCLVRDRLDTHVRTTQQVESAFGLRLLGAVPSIGDLKAGRVTREQFLESYRLIRTTLARVGPAGAAPGSVLVTSAGACEGKTSLAVSLAVSLAEAGTRVLLIDGDVQSPQISRLLQIAPQYDLADVLQGQKPLAQVAVGSRIPRMDVLAGRKDGSAAQHSLNVQSAARILQEAARTYDCVLVDSPPVLGAVDALVWACAVDGVVLSLLARRSDMSAVRLTCQRLDMVHARLLGIVMANVSLAEGYGSYSSASYNSASSISPAQREPPFVQLPEITDQPGRNP